MWRKWLNIFKPKNAMSSDPSNPIHVHATKDGKLYINVTELFQQRNVQELIEKMANSKALKTGQATREPRVKK
jgi:biopolymer transport protein ExbD